MGKFLLRLGLLLPVLALSFISSGQTFSGIYAFGSVSTGSGRTDPTPVPVATGLTFGSFTAVASGSSLSANPNAAGRFSFTGWSLGATDQDNSTFTGSIDLGQYYEVTLNPTAGYAIDLSSITFTLQRSGTGIRHYSVRSSLDGFAANLPASINPANANLLVNAGNVFQVLDASTSAANGSTITLTGFSGLTSAVTFRFYAWDAEASGGTFSIDNVTFNGSATVVSSAPVLAVSASALNFQGTEINTSSTLSYTVNGSNLTADVTLTSAAPFTISLDSVIFSTTTSIPAADVMAGKKVYARFSPTSLGAFNGTLLHTSTGATGKSIALSGTGIYPYIQLTSSPFTETFDNFTTTSTLPSGVSVRTGATSTNIGIPWADAVAKASWTTSSFGFYNYASGDIGTTEPQSTATDRALGVRQTGTTGDPGAAFVFQIENTNGKVNFTMDFSLQSLDASSTRTTAWQVDYGVGSNPSAFTTVSTGTHTTGGETFGSDPIQVNFGSALDNQSAIITIRVVALAGSGGSGTRASTGIDDVKLSWEDPTAKTITLNATSLSFPATAIGSSNTQTYTIVGQTNLDQPVIITTAAPYSVSTDNITFSNSVSVAPADAFNKTIYVKFEPATGGLFNGTITNESVGAVTKNITLSGEATDPAALTFNFNSCTANGLPGAGWLSINTTGLQKWGCTQFGQNSTNGVSVNGFAGGAQTNEAWLISPALHLSGVVNMPVLSFYSRGEFTGPVLELFVSTDYDGASSPNTATWTPINNANFPTPPGSATTIWTFSDNIDLSAYKSAPNVYLAFKYTSSPALNAARWSIDDVAVTDQSTLLSVSPAQLNFGEVATGGNSTGQPVSVRAVGNTDITLTVPAGYQLSNDNVNFSSNPLLIDQATAAAGTTVYVRFSPTVKKLTIAGDVNISGTGINKNSVALSGSSYPKAETFDVACYNLAFFGSNSTNNATPAKITTQINNIATVMQRLNMDVVAFEEVSSDSALNELLLKMPGYSAVTSNRWSYSFEPADPDFPPQKIGFIYNTATMTVSATEPPRPLFAAMYDSVLANQSTRVGDNFWASGRLPFMATFDANINGQTKKVRLVVIHGKSSNQSADYNRRLFDAQVLKDTLDEMYKNDNVIILGDYNDRLYGSIFSGASVSPYNAFVTDNAGYSPLTRSLDSAGKVSFIGGSGLIDHIIITQPFRLNYIDSSIAIEDARLYISGYGANTASDHLPVYTRFNLAAGGALPITLLDFAAKPAGNTVSVSWTTAMEQSNKYFVVERSADGRNFTAIGRVAGAGNSTSELHYQFTDANPLPGTSFYRLQQVDLDGQSSRSSIATVQMNTESKAALVLSPNPVTSYVSININTAGKSYTMRVSGVDGRVLITGSGAVNQLSRQLNNRLNSLAPGVYVLNADNAEEHYTIRFVKQ